MRLATMLSDRPRSDRRGREVGRVLQPDGRIGAAAQRLELVDLQLQRVARGRVRLRSTGGASRRRVERPGRADRAAARCRSSTIARPNAFASVCASFGGVAGRGDRDDVALRHRLGGDVVEQRARRPRSSRGRCGRGARRRSRSRAATRSRRRASGRSTRARAAGRRALRCRVPPGVTSRSDSASYTWSAVLTYTIVTPTQTTTQSDDHPQPLAQDPDVALERRAARSPAAASRQPAACGRPPTSELGRPSGSCRSGGSHRGG